MKISKILLSVAVAFGLGNADTLNENEKAENIQNLKNEIALLQKLQETDDSISGFIEIKNEILDILEGKVKIEDENYDGQYLSQLEKGIIESLNLSFRKTIESKNYEKFGKLLEIYKIEGKGMIDPYDFLEELILDKNIEFFKILKNKGFDNLPVYDGEEHTFLNYLRQNKADKEILKIFK